MLEVRDLRAGYGATEILRGIDMNVRTADIVAVLGANGAGKTTLNKALSGVVVARSGEIRFEGVRIDRAPASAIVAAGLIHVPEGRKIFPTLTVLENLELGSYRRARARRTANLDRAFATFPQLRERARQLAGTLSGGEQQMLAIGRALMAEPRLLILDEPSLGLAPLLVEEMFALIRALNRDGLAVMLVEQNVVQSLEIATRVYILDNGMVSAVGTAKEVRQNPALRRAYLGL